MADEKMMKDIGLNEPVTVTAPAHMWVAAVAAYADTDWSCMHLQVILAKAQEELANPDWYKSQMEAHQEFHDRRDHAQAAVHRILTGQQPEEPPGSEDPARPPGSGYL